MAKNLRDLTEWVNSLQHLVLMGWYVIVRDGKIIVYNSDFPTEYASFDTEGDDTKGATP
jgi:hypothetical protein